MDSKAHPMPTEVAHDPIPLGVGKLVDSRADVLDACTLLSCRLYTEGETPLGDGAELLHSLLVSPMMKVRAMSEK